MGSYLQDRSETGLERIRLRNRCVELAVLPQAGGKIMTFVDRLTGRNWFWQNPHISPVAGCPQDDFGSRQDTGGWDEVLFSICPDAIDVAGGSRWQVPDHGDVIGRQWQVEALQADREGDVNCTMAVRGEDIPYEFKRNIRLLHEQPKAEMTYFLSNNGTAPMPWFWCAHPLFAVEKGCRIALSGKPPMRVNGASDAPERRSASLQQWPVLELADGNSSDLSQAFATVHPAPGFARKIFMASAECGAVQLLMPGKLERLAISFDPEELPWLGLWVNNRGWAGTGTEPYLNLGIEPATSPYDCISEAIRSDAVTWLQPGEVRTWSLLVELNQ